MESSSDEDENEADIDEEGEYEENELIDDAEELNIELDDEEIGEEEEEENEEVEDGENNLNDEGILYSENNRNDSIENKDSEQDEIIIEEELDEETEKIENSTNISHKDMFSKHFEFELAPEHVDNLLNKQPNMKKSHLKWPILGNIFIEISNKMKNDTDNDKDVTKLKNRKTILLDDENSYADEGEIPILIDHTNFKCNEYFIKSQIESNIVKANSNNLISNSHFILTPLQTELFSIINNYQDLFYPNRSLNNAEEIRFIYCLHALNHMLKTRTKILHHNAKLSSTDNSSKKKLTIIPDNYRDQGLVRPKILILLPFRESAYQVINILTSLVFGENAGM